MLDITKVSNLENAGVIRAFVLGVAHNLTPISSRFEDKEGHFVLLSENGGHVTRQRIVEQCEYTHDDGLYCHGKMLYSVQGSIYVVNSGMFLVVAGWPRAFGNGDDELTTEVFYLGS